MQNVKRTTTFFFTGFFFAFTFFVGGFEQRKVEQKTSFRVEKILIFFRWDKITRKIVMSFIV